MLIYIYEIEMDKCYSNRHGGLINVSCLKVTAQSRQFNQHLLLVNEIDVNVVINVNNR